MVVAVLTVEGVCTGAVVEGDVVSTNEDDVVTETVVVVVVMAASWPQAESRILLRANKSRPLVMG